MGFTDSPLGFFEFKHGVHGYGQREGAAIDRPLPAPRLTGGEGWVGGNGVEVDVHLLVLGIEARVVGDGVSTVSGGLRGSEHGGVVVPVGFGRGEAVEERL